LPLHLLLFLSSIEIFTLLWKRLGEMKGEEKCNWKNGLLKMLLWLLYVVFIHTR